MGWEEQVGACREVGLAVISITARSADCTGSHAVFSLCVIAGKGEGVLRRPVAATKTGTSEASASSACLFFKRSSGCSWQRERVQASHGLWFWRVKSLGRQREAQSHRQKG